MANHRDKGMLERIGCEISSLVSDIAAHPFAQIGVILFCALWWIVGLPTDILTAALSILAITLTQMVLNRQDERERDAHRRDVAMHAKLDELVLASRRARNEVAGIEEELEEEEIKELKEEAKQAIDAAAEAEPNREVRESAKSAVEHATERIAAKKGGGTKRKAQGSRR
jgi:low affinity Fe/Cu permease